MPHLAPRRPPGRAPARLVPSPKPGGGVRWLARLDPADELDYRSAVARITPRIERALGSEVTANRAIGRGAMAWASLEPWWRARRVHRRRMNALIEARPGALIVADVRDCYASIDPAAVAEAVGEIGPSADVRAVVSLLEGFCRDGIPGLPVGPAASAILANAVLARADRALRDAGVAHLRWVDDFVGVARDARHAERALSALREALGSVGLDLHERKTRILTCPGPTPATGGLSPSNHLG